MRVDDFTANVAGQIDQAALNALGAVAEWLTAKLRQDVGHQTGMDGPGSIPPAPPFRRTGAGQAAVTHSVPELVGNEVRVKVGYPPESPGPAYMVMHDQGIRYKYAGWQRRKWLSGALDKYKPEILRILVASFRP